MGGEELTSFVGTHPEATITTGRFYAQDKKDEPVEESKFTDSEESILRKHNFLKFRSAHGLLCEILILLQGKSSRKTEWVMDSGCTNHMTGDRTLLMESSLSPSTKKTTTFPDKGKSKVLGLGRVAISRDQ